MIQLLVDGLDGAGLDLTVAGVAVDRARDPVDIDRAIFGLLGDLVGRRDLILVECF